MASLQSSCTVLTTNYNNRLSPSVSTKPSHLFTNARKSHRFHVSCSGGADQKPSAEGRVDRRNMLLGLGGLYGAANLISDPKAYAAPIQPPDLSSCGTPVDFKTEKPIDVKCCLPTSDTIVDYKLPMVKKLRVRSAAHKLNEANIKKYEEAIRRMRKLDEDKPESPLSFTQQANIHCAYCKGVYNQVGFNDKKISIHYSWLFFPFHRWYLYFYERILGKLIGDPTFALPFWNWDNPPGMQLPKMFDNPYSPLYDENRNPCHRPPAIVDLALNSSLTTDLDKVTNNLSVMYHEMIRSGNDTTDFMGQPYCAGDDTPDTTKGGTSERGSHTSVHAWVGDPDNPFHEDLGNFYSAGRDTAFYCHHANVDRMWTIWKTLRTPVPKDINKPDYLNASFLFFDENEQMVRVKVADCLDYRRMGYEYEDIDTPWLNYRPPRKAAKVKIQDISKGAENADKVFPLKLKKITRVLISKTTKGKADEVLVLEDIETDPRQLIKFDVYINDEDDAPREVYKAEYAGTFAQLPHRVHSHSESGKSKGSINMSLKELYDDIDVDDDDDTVVVTIVPRYHGRDVTIGGIKIVAAPPPKSA